MPHECRAIIFIINVEYIIKWQNEKTLFKGITGLLMSFVA